MTGNLGKGIRIAVKEGVTAPELPEFVITGWTGVVAEVSGRRDERKFFIEWDSRTVGAMSTDYLQRCEEKQLFHMMACLTADALEIVE